MVSAPRGQAMVEMALGLLVFVTIFMFGIHFAEVGYLTLKVQEASSSALWDTTSAVMHKLPSDGSPLQSAIGAAGGRATGLYKDFDGRTTTKGGSAAPIQVFTSAGGLEVKCDPSSDISFTADGSVKNVFPQEGGMTCTSSAVLSPTPRLTRSFLDQGPGSLFQVPHLMAGVIQVCGTGRANGGTCSGSFGLLMDDWALEGEQETRLCKVLSCQNTAYFDSAKKVFDDHNTATGAAMTLARTVIGQAPYDTSKFYMSFSVSNGNFQDKENGGDSDPNNWVTTPGKGSPTKAYDTAWGNRKTCFLGAGCE